MNQLEQTPEEYKQAVKSLEDQTYLLFKFCIGFVIVIFVLCAYTTALKLEQKILYGKIKQDSISIQSYKNLLLTPKNQ